MSPQKQTGMKIALNSPVWKLYSIPFSWHKYRDRQSTLCREQLSSPNHSAPWGKAVRRRVWENEERWRDGGGQNVTAIMNSELYVVFAKAFRKYNKSSEHPTVNCFKLSMYQTQENVATAYGGHF